MHSWLPVVSVEGGSPTSHLSPHLSPEHQSMEHLPPPHLSHRQLSPTHLTPQSLPFEKLSSGHLSPAYLRIEHLSPGNPSSKNPSPRNLSPAHLSAGYLHTEHLSPTAPSPKNPSPAHLSSRYLPFEHFSPANPSLAYLSPGTLSPVSMSQKHLPPTHLHATHPVASSPCPPPCLSAQPREWSKEEVQQWLHFCVWDFAIDHSDVSNFDMNGKALCLLTREDFMERDPASGDLLYNALQGLQACHSLQKNVTRLKDSGHTPSTTAALSIKPRGNGTLYVHDSACPADSGSQAHIGHNHVKPSALYAALTSSPRPCGKEPLHVHEMRTSEANVASHPALSVPIDLSRPQADHQRETSSDPPVSCAGGEGAEACGCEESGSEVSPRLVPTVVSLALATHGSADGQDNPGKASVSNGHQRENKATDNKRVSLSSVGSDCNNNHHNHDTSSCRSIESKNMAGNHTGGDSTEEMEEEEEREGEGEGDSVNKGNGSGETRLLWEFIYQLLQDPSGARYVRWVSGPGPGSGSGSGERGDLSFRIVDPNGLAEQWGKQKRRSSMTYEKLSRALRYYYRMNIVHKVPGKRLTYRFMQHPTRIRKGQRGAKPRCMRNQTPLPIAPSPSSTTPSPTPASSFSPSAQPPDSSKPLSDSKPLDPLHVADEVRRSGLPLSSDSHDVIDSRALLFTPVSSHVQDVSSDSKPNVSLQVKDKRPLSHPKDGIPFVHGSSKPCIKREIFGEKFLGHPYNCDVDMKLFSQLLGPRHQQADGSGRYCYPMEVDGQDFQEEPEDLSLKPPRRWAETEVSERCKLDVSPSPETAEISSILS